MKWYEHLACGWPLVLVGIGGAIGGLCGGVAYGLSVKVFTKDISDTKKYAYSLLISLGAFIAYLLIVTILAIIFPDVFGE